MTQVIVKRRSTDELEHGHKYIKKDKVNGKWRYYYDYNDGDGWSNKAGVQINKTKTGTNVELFNTKADRYWRKNEKTSTKEYGPVKIQRAEDGLSVGVDIPTKKIKKVAKKTVKESKKQIDKGKKKIKKLLGK